MDWPLSMGFFVQLLCPWDSSGKSIGVGAISFFKGLPGSGIEPRYPVLQADSLPTKPLGKPFNMIIIQPYSLAIY